MDEMTLEEAFAAATVDVPSGMVDDIFVIDAPKRKIIVPDSESVFGAETDKDVECKYFRCPRIVGDNIDLYAHKIYVVYVTAKDVNGTFLPEIVNDKYWCDDVAVDGDCITFSWKLSDNVMSRAGIIAFKVLAVTTDGEFEKTRWNTAPAYGTILMTVPDGDGIAERYPDIVTQLLERMDAVETIATEEAMKGFVSEYMKNHPVQLDETLTDPTKAAPANLVGELKGDLGNLGAHYVEMEYGSFNNNTGEKSSNGLKYTIRSKDFILNKIDYQFKNNNTSAFKIKIMKYDKNKSYIGVIDWTNADTINVGDECVYFTFAIKSINNTELSPVQAPIDITLNGINISKFVSLLYNEDVPLLYDVNNFEYGGISRTTGKETNTGTIRARTPFINNLKRVIANNYSKYSFFIYAYSNGIYVGSWDGTDFSKHGIDVKYFDFEEIRTQHPDYEFRLCIKGYNNSLFTIELAKEYISIYLYSNYENLIFNNAFNIDVKFTVGIWNIGHFSDGISTDTVINDDNFDEKLSQFRSLVNSCNVDVLGLDEYSRIFAKRSSGNVLASDALFKIYKYLFEGEQRRYSCNALCSRFKIINLEIKEFECNKNAEITHTSAISATDYYYISYDIDAFGNTIHCITTHIAFDLNNVNIEKAQYQELIDVCEDYEYVIIMGDMNATGGSDEFDVFSQNGYTLANHGYIGDIETYNARGNTVESSKVLDNIFVKGLNMYNIRQVETRLSDHNVLLCDVTF